MNKVLLCAAAVVIGYLLGSVSSGVIVSRLYGHMDIRTVGSGNVGMTNVMRTLGWVPSFITFAGDALKGVLGAVIGKLLAGDLGMNLGGFAAVIGHNWPVFFSFKGGKGMSTTFGYLLIADWRIALILVAVQAVIVFVTGYMSAASITTACALPIMAFVMGGHSIAFKIVATIAALLAVYQHRSNIKRLINGSENKLDAAKISSVSSKMVQSIKDRRNK